MADLWRDWPHCWFGFFCWEETQDDLFPSFSRLVDLGWQPADRAGLLGYLRQTPVCWATQPSHCPCSVCGEPLAENATWRWDGEWLWPHTLAHYVERHGLRLPDALVERVRERCYIPPPPLAVALEAAWRVNNSIDAVSAGREPPTAEQKQAEPVAAPDPTTLSVSRGS